MVNGMKQMNLSATIEKIALAQLIILFHLNINTINLLPDWIGYYLYYQAIFVIEKYEKSASLLRPFALILGVYEGIAWLLQIIGISLESMTLLQIFIAIISIYFQFQLLTNISQIASFHHHDDFAKRFLTLRTMQVISITLVAFPTYWLIIQYMKIIITLFHIFVTIWLCYVLFQYSKKEKEYEDETLIKGY